MGWKNAIWNKTEQENTEKQKTDEKHKEKNNVKTQSLLNARE